MRFEERDSGQMKLDRNLLITVLMGGPGTERDVSLASGKAVLKALTDQGYQAVGVEAVDETPEIPEGTGLVFNVIHGTFGEDGGLQRYLEGLGIPYTGAGAETSEVAFDKDLSKERFVAARGPDACFGDGRLLGRSSLAENASAFCGEAAPGGVERGDSGGEDRGTRLLVRWSMPRNLDQHLLVEEFVEGRELDGGGDRRGGVSGGGDHSSGRRMVRYGDKIPVVEREIGGQPVCLSGGSDARGRGHS